MTNFFGIDHNKQSVVTFSNAARELLNSEGDTRTVIRELGAEDDPLYEIVAHIRNTTRNLAEEIKVMFGRRRRERESPDSDTDQADGSPEGEAVRLASLSTNDRLQEQSESRTQTDLDHEHKDADTKRGEIQAFLTAEGYPSEDAVQRAIEVVRNEFRYAFIEERGYGFQMFSVHNPGGTLFVKLNINHQLYEFLKVLQEDAEEHDNPAAYRAAVGIRTLLLAWARMEDHIEDPDRRQRVQQIALQWGEQASDVLRQLNQQTE